MLNNKAQGLPITAIIVAVIGLIILVVLIAIFTGKINFFGERAEEGLSCESTCQGLGMHQVKISKSACNSNHDKTGDTYIPGTFSGTVDCCCRP